MYSGTDSGFACFIPRLRDPLFQGSSDSLEHAYIQVVHRGKQHCTRVHAEHAFASMVAGPPHAWPCAPLGLIMDRPEGIGSTRSGVLL